MIRKLLVASAAFAALLAAAPAAAASGPSRPSAETAGWCDVVPDFCCRRRCAVED